MRSYEHHIVPEQMRFRHPYIQEPFSDEIDAGQITKSVFDREIPKFAAILLNEELSVPDYSYLKRDTLKTLNEMVSNQEIMDEMIENGMIESTTTLLLHDDPEVREQATLLMGSFMTSKQARSDDSNLYEEEEESIEKQMPLQYTCECLQEKLDDEELKVRVAASWAFYRLSVNRDGCDIIVRTESALAIIMAFMKFTSTDKISADSGKYLILLLECMCNFTNYDNGIEPLLGKGTVQCLNGILVNSDDILKLGQFKGRIQQLSLKVLGNISLNHEGKQEAIDNEVIMNAWKFFESNDFVDIFNASHVLMSCTIHLAGKNQAVNCLDKDGNPVIIQKMVMILFKKEENLRLNIKTSLLNISELPLGFDLVIHELSDKIELLDEVFSDKGLKSLVSLLPKLESYDDPLNLDKGTLKKY